MIEYSVGYWNIYIIKRAVGSVIVDEQVCRIILLLCAFVSKLLTNTRLFIGNEYKDVSFVNRTSLFRQNTRRQLPKMVVSFSY